jgi:hypothetical protein
MERLYLANSHQKKADFTVLTLNKISPKGESFARNEMSYFIIIKGLLLSGTIGNIKDERSDITTDCVENEV